MAGVRRGVRAEDIYDALLDDEALKQLPDFFTEAYGARSCTLHWRHNGGGAEILSHSDYFPEHEMLNYAENFTAEDIWTLRATERQHINQVWNCEQIVAQSTYEKSAFYNEWIRGMGDDTFFCMGTVMQTKWGQGIIGIHRGRTQSTFEEERVRSLTNDVVHLRRMLAMRGRLAGAERKANLSFNMLDTMGEAILAVTPSGCMIHANAAAEEILRRADAICIKGRSVVGRSPVSDRLFKQALAKASDPSSPEATALAMPRSGGGRYDLSFVATKVDGTFRYVLITARDPAARDATLERRLRQLFSLSPVEAYLAVRLSEGATLSEVATERGVALGTVQAQAKAVMAKLGCNRQAEVVKVVTSLPTIRVASQEPK